MIGTRRIRSGRRKGSGRFTSIAEARDFEELVIELSAAFVRVPASDIDREIDQWLKKIVLRLDLDRSSVGQIDPATGKLIIVHQWVRKGLVGLPIKMELAQGAPWFAQTLLDGRTTVFSRVKELPREFDEDLKTFKRYVPKSNVTIPLKIGGEIVGAVGFATIRKERTWTPRLIRRLQLVAEIFGNALERKRAVTENAMLRRELNHVSRSAVMGELTAALAHQLNQPMAAILSNAEAVETMLQLDHPDLQEIKAAVSDIVQDDLRASETIKGLRAFFRREQIGHVPLDPADLLDEVARMVRSDALIRNVTFTAETPASLPFVKGDRVQLQQAIINLILNAFDAVSTADGSREVSIRTVTDGVGHVSVLVSDSGKGIEPEAMSRLFEPFFTTKADGMGMGLAISRSIIEAHGGRLTASSNSDRGATFEISLPTAGRAAA